MKKFYLLVVGLALSITAFAGNPDRQGEAGAAQLLLNPYARSAGLHTMTTANVSGVEALRINPAGLGRIGRTQVVASHALYLQGTDIGLNAIGLAARVGKNGTFGFSLMSIDFGDIAVTTADQPEGTGANFSPSFFNMGVSYAHIFENKVSVGVTFRIVSEGLSDVNAFGFALDAGVQYVAGEQDEFKFGISLRNVGSRMTYGGQGLSTPSPVAGGQYNITLNQRAAGFEMPSMLNIGAAYDFNLNESNRITVIGNFTANSFSLDNIGGGLEYSLNDIFQLRAGYRTEIGQEDEAKTPIYTGLSAGASVEVPLSKGKETRFGIDYAYRQTQVWNGTHNIGIRFDF